MDQVQPKPPIAPTLPVTPVLPTSKPKNRAVVWIAAGAIILVIGIGIGLILGRYSPKPKQITSYEDCMKDKGSSVQESNPPTCVTANGLRFKGPVASPTLTPDPTANWKTYTNLKYGFQIKFSDDECKDEKHTSINERINQQGNAVAEICFQSPHGYTVQINFLNNSKGLSPFEYWKKFDDSLAGFSADFRCVDDRVCYEKIDGVDKQIFNIEEVKINALVGIKVKPGKDFPGVDGWKEIYIPSKQEEIMLNINSEGDGLSDQILSTFKFIDQDKVFCGGFAGIMCPEGYGCKYDNHYPDASGECIKGFESGTLEAKVVRSPTCAGPVTGQENCEGPYVNGTFKIMRLPGNEDIQTISSDKDGTFSTSLNPGVYNLQNTESGIGKNIRNPSFTIAGGKSTIQRFDIDTGIR